MMKPSTDSFTEADLAIEQGKNAASAIGSPNKTRPMSAMLVGRDGL